MADPVAPLRRLGSSIDAVGRFGLRGLRDPQKALRSTAELSQYGLAFSTALARSGLLGPYRPDQLFGVVQAVRRYGLSLGSLYAIGAAIHDAAVAVIDDGGEATFTQMEQRSSTIAAALAEMGVGTESRVGLLCRNHRGLLMAIVALGKVGADTVYLNTGFAGPQLAAVLRREAITALIVDEEFLPVAESSAEGVRIVVAWADDPASLGDRPSFDRILAESRRPAPPPPGRVGRQVILTSGTTGAPKGANHNTGADVLPLLAVLSRIPLQSRDVTLLAAPMYHAWGLVHAALGLALGSTLVLPRRFDAEDTLRSIEAHRVRVLIAVPVMLQRIMQLPDEVRHAHDTSSLKVVALSGSAIPGDLALRFMDEFGDVVYNLYGSTEAGWASIATPADLRAAPGTAGLAPVGTRVRILDDHDQDVPRGQTGRIFVRSGMAFDGYTGGGAKAIVEGYLSTGDMGHFDQGGQLFVEGRDDDMIVSGGENVFPDEVEDLLARHPEVADVAVVGVPDETYGQRLRAYVVLRPAASVTAEDLVAYVRSQLARYKVPREVILTSEIPRNAAGKILRRAIE